MKKVWLRAKELHKKYEWIFEVLAFLPWLFAVISGFTCLFLLIGSIFWPITCKPAIYCGIATAVSIFLGMGLAGQTDSGEIFFEDMEPPNEKKGYDLSELGGAEDAPGLDLYP